MAKSKIAVWAEEAEDIDSVRLAKRLGIPLVLGDEPPGAEVADWVFFREEEAFFLHSNLHPDFNPIVVDYLEKDFYRRWHRASRNDLLAKAAGLKKGVRTICDATCGLGYDAFFLTTFKDVEMTACERNVIVAELVMDALMRIKDMGRFEDFPFYFHLGDGAEYLKSQGPASFDCVYLDPMYPREDDKSAKQKKEMVYLRELVGKDEDVEKLFDAAWTAARKRVVVKRPDGAPAITKSREPDFSLDGKTIRYDIYLRN